MTNPSISFITEVIGAFTVWAFKGFKGKFNDEMTGPYESGWKSWRNRLITLTWIFIIIAVISKINDKKAEKYRDIKIEMIIKQ